MHQTQKIKKVEKEKSNEEVMSKYFTSFEHATRIKGVEHISFHSFRSGLVASALFHHTLSDDNKELRMQNVCKVAGWQWFNEYIS